MHRLTSHVSEKADYLRLLLKRYTEAAGIKDGGGKTPYDLAFENGCSSYIQRLLLRADPIINPTELNRLNYVQRKMVMFLAFRAVVKSPRLT